jgi:hypothetical protein
MSNVKLGCIAVELSSGVEGTVVSMNQTFNGNTQYAIQPKAGKDNKLPDAWNFDAALVKYKAEGVSAQATPPQATDINVGDEVEDIISGHKGIASSKTTFINGCIFFNVESKSNVAKKIEATSMFISCVRLKKASKATLKPIVPKGEKPTGGPSTRAQRAN